MNQIKYRKGYKYQLAETYQANLGICPDNDIQTDYINLNKNGQLTILKGYAWDGPSGPTIDTKNFMRGSLEHDALYQLMRMEKLPAAHKTAADNRLKAVCIKDGMWLIRAHWVHQAVQNYGASAINPDNVKPIITAPKTT